MILFKNHSGYCGAECLWMHTSVKTARQEAKEDIAVGLAKSVAGGDGGKVMHLR